MTSTIVYPTKAIVEMIEEAKKEVDQKIEIIRQKQEVERKEKRARKTLFNHLRVQSFYRLNAEEKCGDFETNYLHLINIKHVFLPTADHGINQICFVEFWCKIHRERV